MTAKKSSVPAAEVPQFSLYGESEPLGKAEFVHIELIQTRSRLHDWHIARHKHPGLFQVLFLLAGHVRAQVQDALWECDGPIVIALHPAVEHGFDFSEEAQGYVLTVDQNLIFSLGSDHQEVLRSELLSSLFVAPLMLDLRPAPPLRQRLEGLLHHLLEELAWPLYGHTLMLEWLARSVLLLLARLAADNRSAAVSGHHDFALLTRFRALVETYYKQQWLVGAYAEQLHITPSRLNRLCLRLAGQSAFDMIQQRLILEACRQLTFLPSSVATVAYELGFQDPAYFSRLFRRHTGSTPTEFRRAHPSEG
ncbi:AraC family transcriptional activator of pobA [Herbaspirillum sp. Sphag1AN]|uniref:helix-turn-helix domain-containing protein n=1 Tax=unclassified Herbaspirillum TaxID=2624150 RepID=UPI00160AAFF7|nr:MULTISPECIES: helix-turn-helix domain-containing protein [unclassified Herbaspirillum]MBB3210793.1 AraC family transcriptional activator of pobA [Herbaspirillum sp. Sphag1AN]MBB3244423.1 AraC family transcriptional activator of pobA [Herbaspirillum sp. Sphag64]